MDCQNSNTTTDAGRIGTPPDFDRHPPLEPNAREDDWAALHGVDAQSENIREHMRVREQFSEALRTLTDGYRKPLPDRFVVTIELRQEAIRAA